MACLQIFVAKGTMLHPNWTGAVEDGNDIALLMLNGESRHAPIRLPEERDIIRSGESLSALGWGLTVDGLLPQDLQEANALQLIDNKSCEDILNFTIQSSMVCTLGITINQGLCRGKVFSKILFGLLFLLGVISFLSACARKSASVHAQYHERIYHTMWSHFVPR